MVYLPFHRINHSILMKYVSQAQTPQQRRANEKFAKAEEKKRGKPETFSKNLKKVEEKSPISRTMLSE